MRPQHITAENADPVWWLTRVPSASMRPQHITAENPASWSDRRSTPTGFNEAAAYHCGKREDPCLLTHALLASMRPQHITAENEQIRSAGRVAEGASMRPQHITAENEGRGDVYYQSYSRASMRPQHITAENPYLWIGSAWIRTLQ